MLGSSGRRCIRGVGLVKCGMGWGVLVGFGVRFDTDSGAWIGWLGMGQTRRCAARRCLKIDGSRIEWGPAASCGVRSLHQSDAAGLILTDQLLSGSEPAAVNEMKALAARWCVIGV